MRQAGSEESACIWKRSESHDKCEKSEKESDREGTQ